jgi:5-(carboxyamino)imidazole ribonucleotide synthase
MEGTYVHLYGKQITRPFRKMGHVTVVNKHIEVALETAQKVMQVLKVVN